MFFRFSNSGRKLAESWNTVCNTEKPFHSWEKCQNSKAFASHSYVCSLFLCLQLIPVFKTHSNSPFSSHQGRTKREPVYLTPGVDCGSAKNDYWMQVSGPDVTGVNVELHGANKWLGEVWIPPKETRGESNISRIVKLTKGCHFVVGVKRRHETFCRVQETMNQLGAWLEKNQYRVEGTLGTLSSWPA